MSNNNYYINRVRSIVIRLLDCYNVHVDTKSVYDFSVFVWKEMWSDNNFMLANIHGIYDSFYRLPDFESFKVYIDRQYAFGKDVYCFVIISDNESYVVQLVM